LNNWKCDDVMQQVKVKILDNEYVLKSDEDVEQVYRIAEYVNDKLKEVKENIEGLSDKKTAILVRAKAGETMSRIIERVR